MSASVPSRHRMTALIPNLNEARVLVQRATRAINEAYEANLSTPAPTIAPDQLSEAIEQFMRLLVQLDREAVESRPVTEDINRLGDYGMNLFNDLLDWTKQLALERPRRDLEAATLVVAEWIIRHRGELRTLTPLIGAFAHAIHNTRQPAVLEQFALLMSRVAEASAHLIKQDLDKTDPNRPWRLLLLYRATAAMRSQNPRLMEETFDELVRRLPEDAPSFFADSMQQVATQSFPESVCAVVSRYFERWTRPRMH